MKKDSSRTTTVYEGYLQPTRELYKDTRASAMKGEIVRALVELVTNADDSYRDMEYAGEHPPGDIRIEITRCRKAPVQVVVKDRAAGMSAEEMIENLTQPGARTSGFHRGKSKRGLHGRGGKDVSYFGKTIFESIKNGTYSVCTIEQVTLECKICTRPATEQDYERLGVRKNGTKVTIEVSGFHVPSHEFLAERFERHFVLRDIFRNEHRRCYLADIDPATKKERAGKPVHFEEPVGEVLVDTQEVEIAGFPVLTMQNRTEVRPLAVITVKSHPQPFLDEKHGPNAPYRFGGLLIKSGAAIHENTLLGFENEPMAQSLFGEVFCPYIDELVRLYDTHGGECDLPAWNNVRILDPERDGFVKEHPFIVALYAECEAILRPIVERRKASEQAKERVIRAHRVETWLKSAMRKASRLFEDKLREVEEHPPIDSDGKSRGWRRGLTIIPGGEHSLALGDRKTFGVYVNFGSDVPAGATVNVCSDDPGGIRVISSTIPLKVDPSDSSLGKCVFTVEALRLGAQGFISASVDGFQDVVLVDVVDQIPLSPVEIPPGLSFDREEYKVGYNKTKHMKLRFRGPLPPDGLIVLISSDSAGVAVKQPTCALSPSHVEDVFESDVPVTGRRLGARATIRAMLGDKARATAKVLVTDVEQTAGASLRTPKLVDRDFGPIRVRWSPDEPNLLEVACRHPAIASYLGPAEKDFPGKEREGFRAVLAEAIAEALAWRLIEKLYQDPGMRETMTPTDYYTEYGALTRDFLKVLHQGIAEDTHLS